TKLENYDGCPYDGSHGGRDGCIQLKRTQKIRGARNDGDEKNADNQQVNHGSASLRVLRCSMKMLAEKKMMHAEILRFLRFSIALGFLGVKACAGSRAHLALAMETSAGVVN